MQLTKGKVLFLLIIITILGIFFRLYQINFQSLWFDEIHAMILTRPDNQMITLIGATKSSGSQAFYILLHFVFKIFKYDEIVGRIVCATIGIASIPVLYFLVKEFATKETGIFASLLTALNYFHIYYSQEFNFYTMVFLFVALSYLFLIRAYKYLRDADFIGYTACSILLVNTHSFGSLILLIQLVTIIFLYFHYRKDKFFARKFITVFFIIVLFVPWQEVLVDDLIIGYSWMQRPKFYFIAAYFYNYFGKDVVLCLIFLFLIFLFLKALKVEWKDLNKQPMYIILFSWLILSYTLPFVKSIAGNSILDMRLTVISLPAWLIIIAIGWSKIKVTRIKYMLVIAITLSSIINLFFFKKHYTRIQKQQIREVSQFVKAKNTSGEPMYSPSHNEFGYYFRNSSFKIVQWDPLKSDSLLFGVDKFWLLSATSKNKLDEELMKLNQHFDVLEIHPFFESNALLLRRKNN